MEDLTDHEMDILTLAKEHNNKDAHWLLILSFINDVESGTQIEPDSIEYIKFCLSRLLDGEDARVVFPRINDEGRKNNPGRKLEIARKVTRLLRDNQVGTLSEAYGIVGDEFHISSNAVKASYNKLKEIAEKFERYKHLANKGRPKKNK